MKSFLNFKGVKLLSKNEQKEISGAATNYVYCKGNNQCCMTFSSGFEFCDYGYCQGTRCIWA